VDHVVELAAIEAEALPDDARPCAACSDLFFFYTETTIH